LAPRYPLGKKKPVIPDSPPEHWTRMSKSPELQAVDGYDFKITKVVVFSHRRTNRPRYV
jgi:hypothetical protein